MNASGFRPIGEQVLIFPDPVEQVTETGIQIMTDKELDRIELGQTEGLVVELAKSLTDVEFAAGDRVVFKKFAGILMDGDDGARYRLIDKKDVLGVKETENA